MDLVVSSDCVHCRGGIIDRDEFSRANLQKVFLSEKHEDIMAVPDFSDQ